MNKKIVSMNENDLNRAAIKDFIIVSAPVIISALIPVLWIRLILAIIYAMLFGVCIWYTWYRCAKVVTPIECCNTKIFGSTPIKCQKNSPYSGEDLDFPNSK